MSLLSMYTVRTAASQTDLLTTTPHRCHVARQREQELRTRSETASEGKDGFGITEGVVGAAAGGAALTGAAVLSGGTLLVAGALVGALAYTRGKHGEGLLRMRMCSHCKHAADHIVRRKNERVRSVYECLGCEGKTLMCDSETCPNMAAGGAFDDDYCGWCRAKRHCEGSPHSVLVSPAAEEHDAQFFAPQLFHLALAPAAPAGSGVLGGEANAGHSAFAPLPPPARGPRAGQWRAAFADDFAEGCGHKRPQRLSEARWSVLKVFH